MDVEVTVPEAARLTGLNVTTLADAIGSRALPARLEFRPGAMGLYVVHVQDLSDWCRRCGHTHLWAQPDPVVESAPC